MIISWQTCWKVYEIVRRRLSQSSIGCPTSSLLPTLIFHAPLWCLWKPFCLALSSYWFQRVSFLFAAFLLLWTVPSCVVSQCDACNVMFCLHLEQSQCCCSRENVCSSELKMIKKKETRILGKWSCNLCFWTQLCSICWKPPSKNNRWFLGLVHSAAQSCRQHGDETQSRLIRYFRISLNMAPSICCLWHNKESSLSFVLNRCSRALFAEHVGTRAWNPTQRNHPMNVKLFALKMAWNDVKPILEIFKFFFKGCVSLRSKLWKALPTPTGLQGINHWVV